MSKLQDLLALAALLKDECKTAFVNEEFEFWQVGKNYFIRTVTMHSVGRLKAISDKELLLEKASWIADSGRFHDALKSGEFSEIEPFVEDIIVNRAAIIDATLFNHDLPTKQK